MRFKYPLILFFLPVILIILFAFYYYAFKRKRSLYEEFADYRLIAKLAPNLNQGRIYLKAVILSMVFFIFIIILSRPQFGKKVIELKRTGIDLIIAVDTSLSMLAEDLKPNRLERAKMEIKNLMDILQGDQIGIIVFSGEAFTQCPLTLDYDAARMFLEIIDTKSVAQSGTNLGRAISQAIDSYPKGQKKYKTMILLTDGEDHEGNSIEMAEKAASEGIKIYTIGIGSGAGEPIPLRDGDGKITGYKKDDSGQIVLSKLDEVTLQNIASKTGGKYYRSSNTGIELEKIYKEISSMEKKEFEDKLGFEYEDRYQFLLFIVIFLLMIEFLIIERKDIKKEWLGSFE
ncbi:MAG: VWA domain-containing protein [bacterium]|nr:VWA domain-containing protein [bacterium]